jgi:ankyrin repeat protein
MALPWYMLFVAGILKLPKLYLKNGANVNMESAVYGSPLEAAVEKQNPEMVDLLLGSNANVNFSGAGNPLLSAAIRGILIW